MTDGDAALHGRLLRELVEPARQRSGMSLREAARRSAMSEASWRQLVAGGVRSNGNHVDRIARRDQVLRMAHAAGCLDEVVDRLDVSDGELARLRETVPVIDLAEEEILASRHPTAEEKIRLVEVLRELRQAE